MKAIANKLMIVAMLMVGMVVAATAQDSIMKDDKMMADTMMAKHPIVAVIRADWCAACKKLEPVLMEIAKSYGEKVEFVYLDITDAKTTAVAEMTAERYGISKFFEENKKKSSTVGIFKNMKKLFNTHYNADPKVFTAEIDKALGS
jgi:thiol-disulfide isomerase/thioredoxin